MDLSLYEEHMKECINHLEAEFIKIRTGRANPAILDSVKVEAYGNLTPLNQVALINVPEATQLMVKPFDPSILKEIEAGISKADLDINPIVDGEIIRISIPPLTEETRKVYVKEGKQRLEEAKIAIRNVRKDANNSIKKNDELTEDQKKTDEDKIQKLTDKYNKLADDKFLEKEKDIMTI